MSRWPYRTELMYNLEFTMYNLLTMYNYSLGGVLGTSRTASCLDLMGYTNSTLSPLSPVSLPLPPLGVVGVVLPLPPLLSPVDGVLPLSLLSVLVLSLLARSGNLTFLPKRRSSLVQTTASVRMPLMAPLEKGVLWLDMCSANSSRPMVSSATTRGYHNW